MLLQGTFLLVLVLPPPCSLPAHDAVTFVVRGDGAAPDVVLRHVQLQQLQQPAQPMQQPTQPPFHQAQQAMRSAQQLYPPQQSGIEEVGGDRQAQAQLLLQELPVLQVQPQQGTQAQQSHPGPPAMQGQSQPDRHQYQGRGAQPRQVQGHMALQEMLGIEDHSQHQYQGWGAQPQHPGQPQEWGRERQQQGQGQKWGQEWLQQQQQAQAQQQQQGQGQQQQQARMQMQQQALPPPHHHHPLLLVLRNRLPWPRALPLIGVRLLLSLLHMW